MDSSNKKNHEVTNVKIITKSFKYWVDVRAQLPTPLKRR